MLGTFSANVRTVTSLTFGLGPSAIQPLQTRHYPHPPPFAAILSEQLPSAPPLPLLRTPPRLNDSWY